MPEEQDATELFTRVTFGLVVDFKVSLSGHLSVTSRKTNAWFYLF